MARPRLVLFVRDTLLDLVFPPTCSSCGRVDTRWCDRCQRRLDDVPFPRPAKRPPSPLHGLATTGIHTGQLQHLVQELKYEGARHLTYPLAERLAYQVHQQGWPVDCVVAIPLHIKRLRKRGYNQAKELSNLVATFLDVPDYSDAVHRDQDTRSQVGLSRQERRQNVAGAFRADPVIAGQRVLLVDDVYTTGATLGACANAVMASGASAVYGLTVSAAALTSQR